MTMHRDESRDRYRAQQDGEPVLPDQFRLTGAEFPPGIYGLIVAMFAWFLMAAVIAFSTHASGLDLGMSIFIFAVMLGIPVILRHANPTFRPGRSPRWQEFFSIDIATGRLSGNEATLQILLIPAALALAATLISAAYVYVG